jgi:predicted benzoate:H+ symporter BenE
MTEIIAQATELTPIGAVLVLAAAATVIITQLAKQRAWTKQTTQLVSAGTAAVLGLAAAVVLGMIAGIPDSIIQIVSSILLSIAAVALLAQGLYKVMGYVVPDGTGTGTAPGHGRRADRDGVPDGRDTLVEER